MTKAAVDARYYNQKLPHCTKKGKKRKKRKKKRKSGKREENKLNNCESIYF